MHLQRLGGYTFVLTFADVYLCVYLPPLTVVVVMGVWDFIDASNWYYDSLVGHWLDVGHHDWIRIQ